MNYPKVLIYGQPFNDDTGGGITIKNLFNGWPKEKLAVAAIGHVLYNYDSDACNSYYQLGHNEYKWVIPFNIFQQHFPSGPINIQLQKDVNLSNKNTTLRKRLVENLFYPFLKYTGIMNSISSIQMSENFKLWLEELKPEILYIQVSERPGIRFAEKLQDFLKIPMIIHNMDDWPSTISSEGLFKNYWQKKIDLEFKALINKASLLMSISEDMSIEYQKRYSKNFIPFHNPVNLKFWKRDQKTHYDLNDNPTILYAGRIGNGVEKCLEFIAQTVQEVNLELNISMKFIIQTRESLPWFEKYDFLQHNEFVKYEDLPKIFSNADILILPYDFSQQSENFIKYSMPTKAPEYMISGTPIIIFAPQDTAIVRSAKKYRWATIVTKMNPKLLADEIKSLVLSKESREKLGTWAKNFAEENYNSEIINNRFRNIIINLIPKKEN